MRISRFGDAATNRVISDAHARQPISV
ncbi:MAG: hypothetical protein JWQ91_1829, partial [Aeromicrobium sp.]|nr:hypothetical protein [Aeromicrobium sp.]